MGKLASVSGRRLNAHVVSQLPAVRVASVVAVLSIGDSVVGDLTARGPSGAPLRLPEGCALSCCWVVTSRSRSAAPHLGRQGELVQLCAPPAVSAGLTLLLLEQASCRTSVWLWSGSLHARFQAEPGSPSAGECVCPESGGVWRVHGANVAQWLRTENQCSLEVS